MEVMVNDKVLIRAKTKELGELYPIESAYGSRASLWGCGLRANKVSEELYDKARVYYGNLWNYVGD